MKYLSWNEFDNCVAEITQKCKDMNLVGVYGIPRGGICLAVALSHSLDVPLLNEPKPYSLIVDDIYETGFTLEKMKNIQGSKTFVWITKIKPTWWSCYKIVKEEEWLIFPWENINNAKKDRDNYYNSRMSK